MSLFLTRQVPWMFCTRRGAGVSELIKGGGRARGFRLFSSPRLEHLPKSRGWMDGRTHGSGLGNHVDVVALEDDLVLLGLGLGDGDALEQLDVADALLTEEVAGCDTRVSSKGAENENRRDEGDTHRISTDFLSSAMMTLIGKWA